MKKGLTHVDWLIGVFLFLTGVVAAFIAFDSALSRTDFQDLTRETAAQLALDINSELTWNLKKQKIITNATVEGDWPFELFLNISPELDYNSISILEGTNSTIPAEYISETETLIFEALTGEEKEYHIIYSENTELNPPQFNTNLSTNQVAGTIQFSTEHIEGTATGTGFSNLQIDDVQVINTITMNTDGSSPTAEELQVRGKIIFDDSNATIYHNSSKLLIHQESAETITISTTTSLVNRYYNGSTVDLDSEPSGEINSGTFDWISLYQTGGHGFSIIGESISIVVDKTGSTITVTANTANDFEIYLHEADHTEAQAEKELFTNNPEIILRNTVTLEGISAEKLEEFSELDYQELKNILGTSMEFNYTIDELGQSLGQPIPEDRTVIVRRVPSVYLDRFGASNEVTVGMAIWQ